MVFLISMMHSGWSSWLWMNLNCNIRRSRNRVESYHQLRAAVAKVGGKKELPGKNDIETDISNQCRRLISNAIVYYNSAILSRLPERLEAEGNDRGIEALTRTSPVAWQHILLNGHYTFQSSNEITDLDALVADLKMGGGSDVEPQIKTYPTK